MFRTTVFYDNFTESVAGNWRLYAIIGASLILAGILIFIFPELLAYLIAAFLLFNGVLFFGVAFRLKNLRRQYNRWVDEFWEP
ncbi:DUF3096 domain-containing protein [candidate division KSB1 bacterium]|nr:DUF3096 domain-containing protein [candidate division KSB1 bacterium]NIR70991.1 DUF3096 domain-containing protein [candidate division KSB1 bacterium]NIS24732.1 DUF3096 domain-containing protein [candidate division KSB1 bacterium]NIT71636.1 DUF3096 domain-containing protein [candidate division KSB1 bacterium]NIU25343.1 DUF3096 domain-containing protein [candidate division KSB1 bacterium]